MAQNRDIWARVKAEQQRFVNSEFSLDSLKEMTYLEQVLKEVLRLIPPVGGGFRQVIESCEFQGWQLPQGWMIQYPILAVHEDPSFYPNPKQFDPERFAPEQGLDKQANYSYVPFGGGLRECLGKEFARLEMKIFAAMLARGYDWDLIPEQNLELLTIPTPHPRDGLKVRFY
jgi:cytochrome P450